MHRFLLVFVKQHENGEVLILGSLMHRESVDDALVLNSLSILLLYDEPVCKA